MFVRAIMFGFDLDLLINIIGVLILAVHFVGRCFPNKQSTGLTRERISWVGHELCSGHDPRKSRGTQSAPKGHLSLIKPVSGHRSWSLLTSLEAVRHIPPRPGAIFSAYECVTEMCRICIKYEFYFGSKNSLRNPSDPQLSSFRLAILVSLC